MEYQGITLQGPPVQGIIKGLLASVFGAVFRAPRGRKKQVPLAWNQ